MKHWWQNDYLESWVTVWISSATPDLLLIQQNLFCGISIRWVCLKTDGTTGQQGDRTEHTSRSWQDGADHGSFPKCISFMQSSRSVTAFRSAPSQRPGPRRLINLCGRTCYLSRRSSPVRLSRRPPCFVIRATIWPPAVWGMLCPVPSVFRETASDLGWRSLCRLLPRVVFRVW